MSKMQEPKRPEALPAAATWNAGNKEWEHGKRNADGKCIGEWLYWTSPDGHLCCRSQFSEQGKCTEYERYHPNGEPSERGRFDENGKMAGAVLDALFGTRHGKVANMW